MNNQNPIQLTFFQPPKPKRRYIEPEFKQHVDLSNPPYLDYSGHWPYLPHWNERICRKCGSVQEVALTVSKSYYWHCFTCDPYRAPTWSLHLKNINGEEWPQNNPAK